MKWFCTGLQQFCGKENLGLFLAPKGSDYCSFYSYTGAKNVSDPNNPIVL